MIIVVGNGHGDTKSDPARNCIFMNIVDQIEEVPVVLGGACGAGEVPVV